MAQGEKGTVQKGQRGGFLDIVKLIGEQIFNVFS